MSKCIEHQGFRDKKGYGRINRGGHWLAHREAWEKANGPIPAQMHVLHKCDNPACVKPSHLFIGSNADNVADKMAKGRHLTPTGEAHGRAKLTRKIVGEIRKRQSAGETKASLATEFGVSDMQVIRICRGDQWL